MSIHDSEILRMAREEYPIKSIHDALGVSYTTILEVCEANGIELRRATGRPRKGTTVIVVFKPKSAPKLAKEKPEYRIRAMLKEAASETPQHPYDEARLEMPPLAFAEHILKAEALLSSYNGVEFVGGKYATPMTKMKAANRVLKGLGLPQISGAKEWLV